MLEQLAAKDKGGTFSNYKLEIWSQDTKYDMK
jgi:hypothetical protein